MSLCRGGHLLWPEDTAGEGMSGEKHLAPERMGAFWRVVRLLLLVSGGVESNPGPGDPQSEWVYRG